MPTENIWSQGFSGDGMEEHFDSSRTPQFSERIHATGGEGGSCGRWGGQHLHECVLIGVLSIAGSGLQPHAG